MDTQAAGESLEAIARNSNEMRRSAGNFYKNKTPEIIRNEIYGRNLFIYGDELDPSFDEMVKDGLAKGYTLDKTYEKIITSSQVTNAELNGFLELLARELP